MPYLNKYNKRIGIIATRLGGLDGVSLEVDKWVRILNKKGFDIYLCAGDIERKLLKASLVPYLSVNNKENKKIITKFFSGNKVSKQLENQIKNKAKKIEEEVTHWIKKNKIKKIIVENINSIPLNIPAAVAIYNILERNPEITALFHHHDFYWERKSYFGNCKNIIAYLKKYFPPKRKDFIHITINSIAQKNLLKKHGVKSIVIPNIFDRFSAKKDEYNACLRKDFNIRKDDILFVSPVRIVPRKNLEAALALIKQLQNPKIKFIIAGCADSYDLHSQLYFKKIKNMSLDIKDRIKFICGVIAPERKNTKNHKIYSLTDIYAQADFILYTPLYEGWGNAFGEAMAFGVPTVINRYKIFKHDIEKFGFKVVKINNGKVNKKVVKEVMEILNDKNLKKRIVAHNKKLIKKYFGPEVFIKKIKYFLR